MKEKESVLISNDEIIEAKEIALIVKMSEESMIEDNTAQRHNGESSLLVESLKAVENFSEEDTISEQNEESMTTNGSTFGEHEMPYFPEVQLSMNKDTLHSDEKLVRKIDNDIFPMPTFTPNLKSFRFEENEDKILHEVSVENNLIVNASPENEKLNFIENFDKIDFQFAKVDNDPMLESICLEENVMINPLDEFCIGKKVRSCFAKSENMVEEMIRGVEREFLFMFSFSLDDISCRLDEKNEDKNYFPSEDHPKDDRLLKDESSNVIEEFNKVDPSFIIADKDQISKTFFFEYNIILNVSDQIYVNEKARICSKNHLTENVDEEIDATIVFEKEAPVLMKYCNTL